MTEETIKKILTETRKQVLSAEYHYEIAAKQLLEQHEAEMAEFSEFASKFNKSYNKGGEAIFDNLNLVADHEKYQFFTYKELLTIFKNRNK